MRLGLFVIGLLFGTVLGFLLTTNSGIMLDEHQHHHQHAYNN